MNWLGMDTSALRDELRRLKGILEIAKHGTGSTAELERGISRLEAELERRERILNGNA